LADVGLTSLEADFVEAQTRLVKAMTALRLAQEQHARLFGPDTYQESVDQLAAVLGPKPMIES